MRIGGMQKTSLIDYPGCLAAVLFTIGCRYDCFYCHNRSLIPAEGSQKTPQLSEERVLEYLRYRSMVLEGVVISGGEPTQQGDLIEFLGRVKQLGYSVKLDTNGSHPDMLSGLIASKLIDYAALDVKAPWERYQEICGSAADAAAVQESLGVLGRSDISWEVRTTICPTLEEEDMKQIALQIQRVPLWRWNFYRRPVDYKESDALRVDGPVLSLRRQQELAVTLHGVTDD